MVALKQFAATKGILGTRVFQSTKSKKGALLESSCIRACHRIGRKAGFEATFSWHVLRHTCASHLVMRGVPLKTVQEILGHADMTTTLRYAYLTPEVKKDAVQMLDLTVNLDALDRHVRSRG